MKNLKLIKKQGAFIYFSMSIYVDGKKIGEFYRDENIVLRIPFSSKELEMRDSPFRRSQKVQLSPIDYEESFIVSQNKIIKYFGGVMLLLFIPFIVRLLSHSTVVKYSMFAIIIAGLLWIVFIFSFKRRSWILLEKKEEL